MNTIGIAAKTAAMSFVIACLVPATVWGAPAPASSNEAIQVAGAAANARGRAIALTKYASQIPEGRPIGNVKHDYVVCVGGDNPQYYSAEMGQQLQARLNKVFQEQASSAGYAASGQSIFEDEESSNEFEVAAVLEDTKVDACILQLKGDLTKGYRQFAFEWQVLSSSQRRVVARVRTSGRYNVDRKVAPFEVVDAALAINVRKLLASSEFRAIFDTPPAQSASLPRSAGLSSISYSNKNTGPSTVGDGVGGVVAIFADDGMGSGFLIGSEGLLLTNRHVVGPAKFVKIRWPDGIETAGEVLRSDAKRDVALVKTDPRGRTPLRLATASPGLGEDVYAVGTPLDAKFQSTVTKGIVSANRTFDGFSYIQSDVAVTHGNSGGPLLDKNANVVGITVQGYESDGAPTGLNLFIPIRDALEFLALKPQ